MTTRSTSQPVSNPSTSVAKWVLAVLAIIVLLIAAILVNEYYSSPTSGQIDSGISPDNGDTKINWERYNTYEVELSTSYTITGSGVYRLTGELEDGAIIINTNSEGVVKLILDQVTIKNSTGPAIVCYSADDLVIEPIGENYLEDGKSYDKAYDEDVKGAIYSKADLTFEGEGTINLTANFQDGIVGKDDVKFASGEYNITAADDAIRGKDSVYIVDGYFDIVAKGDGIKSTNDTTIGKGFILIEGGDMKIATGDDGIHAKRSLIINNGNINITKSYEGLEAQNILINNGEISIVASDDGINAGGGSDSTNQTSPTGSDANCILTIEGGNIYINASGDGMDSNGYIHFNGGNVIIDGPTNNGNGALDAGISINQTGGIVLAVGSSGMAETLGFASSIYNISVYFNTTIAANTKITIKDSVDRIVMSHAPTKAFNHLAFGTEDFVLGETYTIYLDSEKYESFTIADITTTIGNGSINQQNMIPPNKRPGEPGQNKL